MEIKCDKSLKTAARKVWNRSGWTPTHKNALDSVRKRHKPNSNHSEIDHSKKIATELRREFGLPQLRIKGRVEAIRDIEGMLDIFSDIGDGPGESPVDAIKDNRQNLS